MKKIRIPEEVKNLYDYIREGFHDGYGVSYSGALAEMYDVPNLTEVYNSMDELGYSPYPSIRLEGNFEGFQVVVELNSTYILLYWKNEYIEDSISCSVIW